MHKRSLNKQIQVSDTCWNVITSIQANSIELERVLVNLLKNAFESMQDSPAKTQLDIRTWLFDPALEVETSDAGREMSESEINRIFNLFYASKDDGLGPGQIICSSIIESQGGKIRVSFTPDNGFNLCFTLPREAHA